MFSLFLYFSVMVKMAQILNYVDGEAASLFLRYDVSVRFNLAIASETD
jgi:hypothetical protein